ncbi:hypothetical protein CGCF415_v002929 [Colletotrichum fructicola]|uniref:Uncharacterized protein n=1 Tax=Colletotrichum fructicola (strain Nara gc5) TaxID=1213859 RepID=L2FGG2_COLFN|nr:uncharacterized protein CGMCC3_g15436 [Colletotrichum fructicola]KAF4482890.1 hypothetical protein CGGC5_v009455 [Colletotrichum fructicola Nara gc5]KAE9568483.1 hypothetical protein CGMCC3_g15436 [Colletotrichum fructicola]KAF4418086.1 hypothetical protein CFRS1_v008226 [Colletotrichum fructicola]KAF4882515.1 hypothetical protein CGCFRS4_v014509 [Colletotrichum fructicola]KAF4913427.1 hypothetical protein CGCF415_v002929 [Colletotrichum fructicola]
MDDSAGAPGMDIEQDWDSSSDASTPRSDTFTNTLFSNPDSPASFVDTEMSFPGTGPDGEKQSPKLTSPSFGIMPSFSNHIFVGQTAYPSSHLRAMRDELRQARKREEFPNTTSNAQDPKTIVEDYQCLMSLRDVRGDPSIYPPPEKYTQLKIEIARRIKTRDEAEGGSTQLEEIDNRVQSWMGSINKEARMLEITQAALQRKGISNPTQADLDAIAEEFMQIAERTLLDVANPLRMNATRMEGNMSRFDSQLSGFDGAMSAQLHGMTSQLNGLASLNNAANTSINAQITGLSNLNDAVNASMSAQVNTLNDVLTNLQTSMSKAVGASAEAMNTSTNAVSTAMASQLSTLNTMLSTQSSTFDGSLNMLNTSLNTVTSDLQKLTASLPDIIAAATQAAVQQQLASASNQNVFPQHHHVPTEAPPSYIRNAASTQFPPTPATPLPVYYQTTQETNQDMSQQDGKRLQTGRAPTSGSRFQKFMVKIIKI